MTLDKFLKPFLGDAVVVDGGQLTELLQDFIWRAGDIEGQWVRSPCFSLTCLVEDSGQAKVALPGDVASDISTNCLSSW